MSPDQPNTELMEFHGKFDSLRTGQKRRALDMHNKLIMLIRKKIRPHMGWTNQQVKLWMNEKNPAFGMMSPDFLIVMGKGEKVLKFVTATVEENKGFHET